MEEAKVEAPVTEQVEAEPVVEQAPVTFDDIDSIASGEIDLDAEVTEGEPAPVEATPEGEGLPSHKVVINGEEVEVSQEEMIRNYQAMKASQERFQEAARLNRETQLQREEAATVRKQWEDAKALGTKDPEKLLKELGVDYEELAYKIINEKIDEESMTPEQKEAKVSLKRAEEAEGKLKLVQEQDNQRKFVQYKDAYRAKYDKEIKSELLAQDIPITRQTIAAVATSIARNIKSGTAMPVSAVVSALKPNYNQGIAEYVQNLTPEQFSSLIGDEFMSKIRANDLSKVRNPIGTKSSNGNVRRAPSQRKTGEQKTLSTEEFEDYLDKIIESGL